MKTKGKDWYKEIVRPIVTEQKKTDGIPKAINENAF